MRDAAPAPSGSAGHGTRIAAEASALRRAAAAAEAVERRACSDRALVLPAALVAVAVARSSDCNSRSRYVVTVAASPASSASRMPGRNWAAYPVLTPGA